MQAGPSSPGPAFESHLEAGQQTPMALRPCFDGEQAIPNAGCHQELSKTCDGQLHTRWLLLMSLSSLLLCLHAVYELMICDNISAELLHTAELMYNSCIVVKPCMPNKAVEAACEKPEV